MSKLIFIDQSLAAFGGHHFECARLLLSAAEQAGWETVTATNVGFQPGDAWPAKGAVFPLFHTSAYTKYAVLTGTAEFPLDPFDPRGCWRLEHGWWRRPMKWRESIALLLRLRRLRRRISREIRSLTDFWRKVNARVGDYAFLQTVSDYDLNWLCRFLAETPGTRDVIWHLQFHNNFLHGWEPEYATQATRLSAMREHFQSLFGLNPRHDIRLYATTPALVEQFRLLELDRLPLQLLECPANPELWLSRERNTRTTGYAVARVQVTEGGACEAGCGGAEDQRGPLKVVCGGYGRGEKGWGQLDRLLAGVWSELFESGRCQLQVQATAAETPKLGNRSRHSEKAEVKNSPYADVSRLAAERLDQAFGPQADSMKADDGSKRRTASWRQVPHPLPTEDYIQFLRQADIGLFLYDPRRYYCRYSAVLAEMLCVGVPVIVPAASWLAEQIAVANDQYLSGLMSVPGSDASGQLKNSKTQECQLAVPESAADLLMRFAWDAWPEPGAFVRVEVVELDGDGRVCRSTPHIVRPLKATQGCHGLVPLLRTTRSVAVTWRDHVGKSAERMRVGSARFLKDRGDGVGHLPRGAIGMVFAEADQVGDCLRDIVSHFEHYQASARAWAVEYRRRHLPSHILAGLWENKCLHSPPVDRSAA